MSETPEEKATRKRHIEAIRALNDDELFKAYAFGYKDPNLDVGDPTVKAVLDARLATRIAEGTKAITEATRASRLEVQRLANSSDRLEGLTKTLRNLTWALIFITILAAAVPIGIEVWNASHEHQIELTPVNPQP